jgi:tripartite ATP-independent transporter DctP family solute receptor
MVKTIGSNWAIRFLLIISLVIMGKWALTGSTSEAAPEQIVLKMGHVGSVEDVSHLTALKLAELTKEKTAGRVRIDIYPSSQLGGPRDMIEGLELGTVDIVLEPFARLSAYTPLASIQLIYYMIRDREHAEKVWNGPIGKELFSLVTQKCGILVLTNMWRGTRNITSTKPIHKVEDLKGLKIRVPPFPISIDTWKTLGASPTPLEFNELFMALKQGIVEAQENPIALSFTSGFPEVCKYWVMTNHLAEVNSFLMAKKKFDSFDKDTQKAIYEAGLVAAKFHGDFIDNMNSQYIDKLKKQGNVIINPNVQEFRDKLKGFVNKYPDLQPWYEKIVAVK